MAKVRERARPWRSILALVVAVAGAVAAEVSGVKGWSNLSDPHNSQTARLVYMVGAAAFLVFGLAAALGLSSRAGARSQQLIGRAHAGILRYVLVLLGVFAVLTISLAIAHIDVKQLLVSGAVAGVLIGIAAQQSLANLFAGLVLLFAHPFRVGDRVRLRAGALSGQVDGTVLDLSLAYVRLDTDEGPLLVPNSQALAAAVLLMPDQGGAIPEVPSAQTSAQWSAQSSAQSSAQTSAQPGQAPAPGGAEGPVSTGAPVAAGAATIGAADAARSDADTRHAGTPDGDVRQPDPGSTGSPVPGAADSGRAGDAGSAA